MHRNPSVMVHQFSQVPKAEIPRSTFDRSHGHKTCFNAGQLIPIFFDEALPGDTFTLNMTGFARLTTPIFPIMDNIYMDTHFFSCPVRLIWDNWQRFNGEQDEPDDSVDFLIPQIAATAPTHVANSIYDYMGLPLVANYSHSALFNRAYALTWNQWFRDQNIQNSVTVPKNDGPDAATLYTLLPRNKRHDYFTSALPWPQKGPGVMVPLGTLAPVKTHATDQVTGVQTSLHLKQASTGNYLGTAGLLAHGVTNGQLMQSSSAVGTTSGGFYPANLYADLTNATGATINSLRQAFQIQRMYERDARGGTRYVELLRSHFGVTSPDGRMQRVEYLGGGSSPVNISPIPQTSGTPRGAEAAPDATPQGNLAAMGTSLLRNHGFTHSFTEHCIILGVVSVRADLTYQQGLARMFSRRTRFDHYWPALSHLGEQAVLQKEIYCTGVGAEDDKVFGYQERHAEYRYKPSIITSLFRSAHPQSLDAWHLSQDFTAAPTLNNNFIVENPPIDRVVAVTNQPHFLFDSYFRLHCARPMPVYGVPGMMDHF